MLEVWHQANLFHVGLYAADEERVGHTESGHESMEGVLGRRKEISTFPGAAPYRSTMSHCATMSHVRAHVLLML